MLRAQSRIGPSRDIVFDSVTRSEKKTQAAYKQPEVQTEKQLSSPFIDRASVFCCGGTCLSLQWMFVAERPIVIASRTSSFCGCGVISDL